MCRCINDQFSMETSKAMHLADHIRRSLFKANFMAVENVLDHQPLEKPLQAPSLTNTLKTVKQN